MHYTKRIPKSLAKKIKTILNINTRILRPTYGRVLDLLADKYNIHIELKPFKTYTFANRTGFNWILNIWNQEEDRHQIISEESEYEYGSFGGSWKYTMDEAIERAITFITEKKKKS